MATDVRCVGNGLLIEAHFSQRIAIALRSDRAVRLRQPMVIAAYCGFADRFETPTPNRVNDRVVDYRNCRIASSNTVPIASVARNVLPICTVAWQK